MKALLYSLLGFFFFIVVLLGSLAWKIQQEPMNLEGIKPKLEQALSDESAGYNVSIGSLFLTWPDWKRAALFDVKNAVISQNGKKDIAVQQALMSLSVPQLFLGRLRPHKVIIEDLEFDISYLMSTVSDEVETQIEASSPEGNKETTNWFDIQSIASLGRVDIKRLLLIDSRKENKEDQYLLMANISLQRHPEGVEGNLVIDLPGDTDQKASIESNLLLRKKEKDITGLAQWKNIDFVKFKPYIPENFNFPIDQLKTDGTVQFVLDEEFKPDAAKVTMETSYESGIIGVEASLNKTPDQTSYPLKVTVDKISPENLAKLFPESVGETSAGEWLFHKIKEGLFRDIVFETLVTQTTDNDINASGTKVSFVADRVTVKYNSTLMPVTNVVGKGQYENDTLTIDADQGTIGGDIKGRNVKLKMTDLSVKGGGLADISLQAKGSLKTALKYIADEPIAVSDQLGFSPDKAKGDIDFNLQLNFPTVKDLPKEEVIVKVDGVLTKVSIPDMVRGLTLAGGPYDLKYDDGAVSLKGSGQLSNQAITLDWTQYLSPEGKDFEMKVDAQVTSDKAMRAAFGIGLEDYISGDLPVDVKYIDYGKKSTVDVKGDLAPTKLHIEPLAYNKASGTAGQLSLKAHLSGDNLKEISALSLKTSGLVFDNGRILFRRLQDGSDDISRGSIPSVTLGKSKVSVDFEAPDSSLMKAVVKGDLVDLEPILNKDPKPRVAKREKQQKLHVSIDAKNMLGDKGEEIKQPKLYFETDDEGDISRIEMDAKIGQGDFYLRFKPDQVTGERSFILESTDAGHTLKTFGLYDKMRGGTIRIIGRPYAGDKTGDLSGKTVIQGFKLKSAPVLAKLLGAMSVKGMEDLLKNDGIAFKRLESDFEWRFRDDGNVLVIKEGKTSGSSLGLTFGGVLDQNANTLDLSGTVVPVSGVNNFIGGIPVLGDILTGGEALFAASYTMSGDASDPKVVINPLSVLTPGILRKIFFEQSPESKEKELIKKRENENVSKDKQPANDNNVGQTNTNLKTKKEAE